MKKLVLFMAILMVASFGVYAQKSKSSVGAKNYSTIKGISKGSMVVGGLINMQLQGGNQIISNGITSITADAQSETTIVVQPYFGYFLSNKFMLGIGASYMMDKLVNPQVVAGTTTYAQVWEAAFVPQFRLYKQIGGLQTFLQGEVSIGFGDRRNVSIINSVRSDAGITSISDISFGIRPGIDYFISKNFALELSVGYLGYGVQSQKQTAGGVTTSISVGSLNFQYNNIVIGGSYFF